MISSKSYIPRLTVALDTNSWQFQITWNYFFGFFQNWKYLLETIPSNSKSKLPHHDEIILGSLSGT